MGGGPRPGYGLQNEAPPTLPAWVQVLILIPIVGIYAWTCIQDLRNGRRPGRDFWIAALGTILASLLLFNEGRLTGIESKVTSILPLHAIQFLAVLVVVLLGWGAHRFKRRSKRLYGIVEILFGALSAIAVVTRFKFAAVEISQMSLSQFSALVASSYVVARGLNNYYEAKHPGTLV
jgi:hypothetical protein